MRLCSVHCILVHGHFCFFAQINLEESDITQLSSEFSVAECEYYKKLVSSRPLCRFLLRWLTSCADNDVVLLLSDQNIPFIDRVFHHRALHPFKALLVVQSVCILVEICLQSDCVSVPSLESLSAQFAVSTLTGRAGGGV